MASELKPWKYEIKYGPEGEDAYSWVYDDNGAMVATMKTHKAKEIVDRMNTPVAPVSPQGIVISNRFYEHLIALTGYHITRPPTPDHEFVNVCNGDLRKLSDFMDTVAPVSPDATGKCGELETVGWLWEYAQYRTEDRGYYGYETVITENSPADHVSPIEKVRNSRELVTRSQAEELLAAKDAYLREINELLDAGQGDDDGAQILPDFEDGMSVLGKVEACLALLEDRRDVIEGFEADNATKAARIKELEADLKTFQDGTADLVNEKIDAEFRAVDLEAKLTAAEKALKTARPYVEDYDTRRHNTGVDETLTQIDAALGGKPS